MKLIDQIERELYESGAMDIYKKIRQKVNKLKTIYGFKCKMCGRCCTPDVGLTHADYFYMKEKNVNLEGIEVFKYSDGSLIPKKTFKHKSNKYGSITGICFYEHKISERTICTIHPNNPLVCHSFPFVVNLENSLFIVKEVCTWMQWNFEKFAILLKYFDEIKDLIKEYYTVLEQY